MDTVSGNTTTVVYGKGDVCLKLNPFDNYRMFTLYDNWKSDDRKPLDLSNGQKMYLIFRSKNKEIRIPEMDTVDTSYTVDKVNGQVLFKINQKNAVDILAMDTRTFYITRTYETYDTSGEKVLSSDEEVMYTGLWKEEGTNTIENYTSQIKSLTDILEERNTQIKDLQESNVKLIEQNTNFATQLETLKDTNDQLSSQITELEKKVNEYESGAEYTGTVIGEGQQISIISGRKYTEDELKKFASNFEGIKIS